ncbi:MAG: phenylalanine--tRNA ligase subunit beta [Candidatus Micrarchaeota archaeon]
MAIITISCSEITKLTDLDVGQVLATLSEIGMPCNEKNDELFVEITPNRPDLFSIEGIARALNSYHGKKQYTYNAKKSDFYVKRDSSVGVLRPYIVAAVVKNININEDLLKSLMQLQEKLHETVGRKRKKVAIGVHDFDRIEFPLVYKFVNTERFAPLDFDIEMDVAEILEKHPKGRAYAHLIYDKCRQQDNDKHDRYDARGIRNDCPMIYPMIYDQKGVVSFPPIINCERTRVNEKTKNLLIESTGTHIKTLWRVLNIIVCALADRGGEIYEVDVDGEIYPKLAPIKKPINFDTINKVLGKRFDKKQILDYLTKMGWQHNGKANALIPAYRLDVMHDVDVIEDVAIAHGYNNFAPCLPDFFTPGSLSTWHKMHQQINQAMVGMGFIEVVNYSLTHEDARGNGRGNVYKEAHEDMRKNVREDVCKEAVVPLKILNPKTEEFTVIRTSVIKSLLNNLALNKTHELPIKIFEIGHVYNNGEKTNFAFAISAQSLDFSTIRGVFQSISNVLERNFVLKKSQNKYFISNRSADIYLKDSVCGCIGEIAPEILETFGIENPVCMCEITLDGI